MTKKVDVLLKMAPPRNKKQLRSFSGSVNFYKSMFPRSSHVLQPLTMLIGDKPFIWGKEQADTFNEMKVIMAADCLNAYHDLGIPFDVVCDASDYQLGATIL